MTGTLSDELLAVYGQTEKTQPNCGCSLLCHNVVASVDEVRDRTLWRSRGLPCQFGSPSIGQQGWRSRIFSIARQRKNVRFLLLPSQSTSKAFLLCNHLENLGDHIF